MTKKPIRIKNIETITPSFANTFRIGTSEHSYAIDFGYLEEKEEGYIVEIISRIVMDPNMFKKLVLAMEETVKTVESGDK